MSNAQYQGPTPLDEDWEPEFDPEYDKKTKPGGVWHDMEDDDIAIQQIEEFKNDEHERRHRQQDEDEANEGED
jgi:hypothetical protein